MAAFRRPAEAPAGPNSQGWLLTFSDMVTLLLTFFVLIISITTTDPRSFSTAGEEESFNEELAQTIAGPGALGFSNPALLAPLVDFVENYESLPIDAMIDQREFKAALFQLDPQSTPDYQELEETVTDSVSVFRDERGLVVRWDKAVLFPEGSAVLRPEALGILSRMAALLARLKTPVSLDCHTNPLSELEGGTTPLAYRLSAQRAKAAMGYFVDLGLGPSRFRLGAFGGGRPVTMEPAEGARNSRLEIVIYRPAKSSWKG
ncbi:MAG: OmpA family protein [Deltaproteobacteria bacterium]|jgi:chemotaxis protein MotB|nr:OmpA family protein [Deltaproteobacteria bacterium]